MKQIKKFFFGRWESNFNIRDKVLRRFFSGCFDEGNASPDLAVLKYLLKLASKSARTTTLDNIAFDYEQVFFHWLDNTSIRCQNNALGKIPLNSYLLTFLLLTRSLFILRLLKPLVTRPNVAIIFRTNICLTQFTMSQKMLWMHQRFQGIFWSIA